MDVEREIGLATVVVGSRKRVTLGKQHAQPPPSVVPIRSEDRPLLLDEDLDERVDMVDPVHLIEPLAIEIRDQPKVVDRWILGERRLDPLTVVVGDPDVRHDVFHILCDEPFDLEFEVVHPRESL